jgi:NTP pyrophosphatase (non-canonical NTP hydrolase)
LADLSELTEKAEAVSRLYAERCAIRRDDDWYALKLQEECGELVAEYLRSSGRGRLSGMAPLEVRANLADEAADLLAQLLLFCRHNDVDVEAALERKWFRYLEPMATPS